jgi:N-acetyl-gamma-glutamyl-phosphate reductase
MIKVAILGGSGYTAAELIKILLRHPEASLTAVTTRQASAAEGRGGGTRGEDREEKETPLLSQLHPSLTGRIDLRCETFDPDRLLARGVQCAFSCLPHGVSRSTLPALLNRGVRVIDLSADYRLRDPNVYAQWYGESHGDLVYLTQAVYGLPEIYGEEIATAQLVANPGCYPQTAILGLAPLLAGKHIDIKSIIVDSKSGVSGAGRTPKLHTHFPECNESVTAYNVGQHRHTPEIDQALSDVAGEPVEVIFTPHLIPMDRGIFTTIYAVPAPLTHSPSRKREEGRGERFSEAQLLDLYREYYRQAKFVRVVPHIPATKDSVGTNFLDLTVRMVRGRIVILAALDNLVRGASGVAVQNFNRMYGLEETMGLW